jgi:putative aminopeptidase FrvX
MALLTKKSKKFIQDYLNNASPTGFESPGQRVWLDYLKPYIDDWGSDAYGTVYGIVNPGQEYKVVIEAHAGEISWFVSYIGDDGMITVCRNGGSDHMIAPSKRVNIHTRNNGIITGVFGWPAIHTRRGENAKLAPKLDNIFIDVGAKDKQEVLDMGIHVGCVITYPDPVIELNDRYFCGRALDNRMGGVCIAEVARLLKKNGDKLPFTLYIVNSVQEEVGLRGAGMIAHTLSADLAIVTDVTHDTSTPMISKKTYGDVKCGRGPTITYAPACHNNVVRLAEDVAMENNIPFQREAASRSTGTDTDAFAYSKGGTPSVLISLPLRYMHTTVEMAHKDDIENTIRWIYQMLLKVEKGQSFKFI